MPTGTAKKLAQTLDVTRELDKMRQDLSKEAPSMVPQPRPKKERAEKEKAAKEVLPTIQSIISNRADRLYLIRKVEEYGQLCEQIAALKKEQDRLKPLLKQAAERHKLEKVNFGQYTLSYYGSGTSKSISREALLNHGVAPDVIAACTVEKEKEKGLRVTPVGTEEGEEV